jgi:hypothetical protein
MIALSPVSELKRILTSTIFPQGLVLTEAGLSSFIKPKALS